MDWESFGVVGFDLGPLFQGQMMVHWIGELYSVDTNLHRFSDA